MPKRKRKELTFIFDDPNPPGVLEQKLAEMCADNLAIMLKDYPPDIARTIAHKILEKVCDGEISVADLAFCDANKFEPKLDEVIEQSL